MAVGGLLRSRLSVEIPQWVNLEDWSFVCEGLLCRLNRNYVTRLKWISDVSKRGVALSSTVQSITSKLCERWKLQAGFALTICAILPELGYLPLPLCIFTRMDSSHLVFLLTPCRGLDILEALRVPPSCFRSFYVSDNAFDGPIRNKMAAQCLVSSISRLLKSSSLRSGIRARHNAPKLT